MRITVVAACAVVSSALFAQESITVDLSQRKGCPVAMEPGPITNKLILSYVTNSVSVTNVLVDPITEMIEAGTLTNMVRRLVEEGHVCSVIGHKWEDGCGKPGCITIHNYPIRHCVVCGATQTQKPGEWK